MAVQRTKKPGCCYWCCERIETGDPAVWENGYVEDFYSARFHPECWRAMILDWGPTDDDAWPPEGTCQRGRYLERGDKRPVSPEFPFWPAGPVSPEELQDPFGYNGVIRWRT